MKDSTSQILATRLWREIVARNSLSFIPHFLLAIGTIYIAQKMHQADPLSLISQILVLAGCLLRILVFKTFCKNEVPSRLKQLLFYFSLLLIGLGWTLFNRYTHHFYGYHSLITLVSFLILMGIISAALPANASRPVGYCFLVTPIIIIPTLDMFENFNNEHAWQAFGIYFFTFFNLFQLRVSYSYIRNFFENDLAITLERDKMQNLINAVPGYVSFVDKKLNYISVNEFGKHFFSLNDYQGKNICGDSPESEFSKFIFQFMEKEKHTAVSEIKFQMDHGISTFIVSIKKIIEPLGGAVIVAIPMDELIETREKMKAQEAKSLYTAKLVSLGEMAAGIAHEINNPLAIIMGSSDQMMRQLKKPDIIRENLMPLNEKIQQMVDRISSIIKSLRVLARNGEKDPFIPFKLEAIIEPSIEISRQRFKEEEVELQVIRPDEDIECIGQEVQLSQVMMNLLNNAFDAALEGSRPRWVRLQVKPGEEHVDICIQDSGSGIPLEIRNKIMEPFFTTKAINKGTGLGLSISKSIMDQHGGILALEESSPHTSFIMRMKKKTK